MARPKKLVDPVSCSLCGRVVEREDYLEARGRCKAGWQEFRAGQLGACTPHTRIPFDRERLPGTGPPQT